MEGVNDVEEVQMTYVPATYRHLPQWPPPKVQLGRPFITTEGETTMGKLKRPFDQNRACCNCIAWDRLDDAGNGFGRCKYHPPAVVSVSDVMRAELIQRGDLAFQTDWPVTTEDDWCMRHQFPPVKNRGSELEGRKDDE